MWDERMTNLGKIIECERLKKDILQDDLVHGICTQGELTKIESGERIPEKLLADALMQRLGRCTDTLETVMSMDEYILFDIRETLQRCFYEGNFEKNLSLLEKYGTCKEMEWPLHQQFLCKYKAVNEYRRDGDALRCCKALERALEITFREWKRLELMEYRLCHQELHLLILIGYFLMSVDEARAVQILEEVVVYLERRYYEEEKVKLFPQCMWLLAKCYRGHAEWSRVEECSRRGIECLAKNGALPLLAELLELRIESLEKLRGEETDKTALRDQLESLKAVLHEYADWVLAMDDLSRLHYFYHEDEVSLDYEMLRDMRKNQGIAQGKLRSCTQGNLSRIETGKQNPSKKRVVKIAEELGVDKRYYISRVHSEDYNLYELCHWRNQAGFNHDWDKAADMTNELEQALDMSIPVNRQYIEACRIGDKKVRGEIEPKEALRQLEEILRYTMPDYREGKMRVPSREEFVILNLMASFMRKEGKMEEGLQLREHILQTFRESLVKEEYHTNSMLLLYLSYGEMLEANGQLELAEDMDIIGIKLNICCGQGEMLGKLLANLAYAYNKSDSSKKRMLCKDYFWYSYQLCLLMKRAGAAKVIEECYQSLFGSKLNAFRHLPHQTDQKAQYLPDSFVQEDFPGFQS